VFVRGTGVDSSDKRGSDVGTFVSIRNLAILSFG
jgi:hypothetical protein